jgi:hypothetical protein
VSAPYQLLPDLTPEEYAALKADIAKRGYDPAHPIVVDEAGNILDGHHRMAACRELGITPPTVTRAGLTEEQKLEYALSANLRRRHLGQEERRALVRRLSEGTGWSVRTIERATGIPKSTVARYLAPVPNGTADEADPRATLEHTVGFCAGRFTTFMAELDELATRCGATLDEATLREIAEQMQFKTLVQAAARSLVRKGEADMPPEWWEPLKHIKNAGSPLAERNRLVVWELHVDREAGHFLTWCQQAGIKLDYSNKRFEFPGRLRYPSWDDHDAAVLPGLDWTAEDEHLVALGHFWLWYLTEEELCDPPAVGAPTTTAVADQPTEDGPPRSRLRGPLGAQQNARRQRAHRQRGGTS